MISRLLTLTCCIAILASSSLAAAAVPGTEQFNGGLNGWAPSTVSTTLVHIGAGGNPGGFIQLRKDLGSPVDDVAAFTGTPNLTGDYGAAGIARVSVDLNFGTNNVTNAWVRYRPDAVTNGWLHPLTNVFPTNVWNTYTVDFNPAWSNAQAQLAGWITDQDINPAANPSPPFATVMSAVGVAEVRFASPDTSTLVSIDNYSIAVPEPGSTILCVIGAIAGIAVWRRRRR
jgi:hypothetical protein